MNEGIYYDLNEEGVLGHQSSDSAVFTGPETSTGGGPNKLNSYIESVLSLLPPKHKQAFLLGLYGLHVVLPPAVARAEDITESPKPPIAMPAQEQASGSDVEPGDQTQTIAFQTESGQIIYLPIINKGGSVESGDYSGTDALELLRQASLPQEPDVSESVVPSIWIPRGSFTDFSDVEIVQDPDGGICIKVTPNDGSGLQRIYSMELTSGPLGCVPRPDPDNVNGVFAFPYDERGGLEPLQGPTTPTMIIRGDVNVTFDSLKEYFEGMGWEVDEVYRTGASPEVKTEAFDNPNGQEDVAGYGDYEAISWTLETEPVIRAHPYLVAYELAIALDSAKLQPNKDVAEFLLDPFNTTLDRSQLPSEISLEIPAIPTEEWARRVLLAIDAELGRWRDEVGPTIAIPSQTWMQHIITTDSKQLLSSGARPEEPIKVDLLVPAIHKPMGWVTMINPGANRSEYPLIDEIIAKQGPYIVLGPSGIFHPMTLPYWDQFIFQALRNSGSLELIPQAQLNLPIPKGLDLDLDEGLVMLLGASGALYLFEGSGVALGASAGVKPASLISMPTKVGRCLLASPPAGSRFWGFEMCLKEVPPGFGPYPE